MKKNEQLAERAQREVEFVKQNAAIVFLVKDDKVEECWHIINKDNCLLNVLAVIGKGKSVDGICLDEVILSEIGIGRTRPFHLSRPLALGNKSIPARLRGFGLSADQYKLVAPRIFEALQELVYLKIACLENGHYTTIYSPHYIYSRRQKKLWSYAKIRTWPRGRRFSVCVGTEFVKDVFWAERNLNTGVRRHLSGLARFIMGWLMREAKEWRRHKDFFKLKRVLEIQKIISGKSLPSYLLAGTMDYIPRSYIFYPYMAKLFFGQEGEVSAEKNLISSVLPEPANRLGNAQIRVVSGILNHRDYVTFEVYPVE